MLGRSWAVQRNQDKSPGAAKPLAVEREGETSAEHPNPQLPGAAVTARPPDEPGVGAAGGLGSWEAITPRPNRRSSRPRGGQAQAGRMEGGAKGPCHSPTPTEAGHPAGDGEHEPFPQCSWSLRDSATHCMV